MDLRCTATAVKLSSPARLRKLAASGTRLRPRANSARLEEGGLTDRFQSRRPVEDADGDFVFAEASARDAHELVPLRILHTRVQAAGELGDRAVLLVAVVLELREDEEISVEGFQRGEELGRLPLEAGRVGGSAGGRKAAAATIAVEEVLEVERDDPQRLRLARRRARPGGCLDALGRGAQAQGETLLAAIDHALEPEEQPARAQGFGLSGPVPGKPPLRRAHAPVVEHEHPPLLALGEGAGGIPRRKKLGGLERPLLAKGHDELTVRGDPRLAGEEQGPGDANSPPQQRLGIGGRGRKGERRGLGGSATHDCLDLDQGEALEHLRRQPRGPAAYAHLLARRERLGCGIAEHE